MNQTSPERGSLSLEEPVLQFMADSDPRRVTPNGCFRVAFTLIELLVVIAIVALLAALLLPSLARAKGTAQGAKCQGNLKQFGYAWTMYTHDNNDNIPPNLGGKNVAHDLTWVRGWLDPYGPDSTNTLFLKESHLGPFLSAFDTWRCPADKSTAREGNLYLPRVRSISMNHFLNPMWPISPEYNTFKTISDMPVPTSIFVFLDEREDSINDGAFAVSLHYNSDQPESWTLADYPASYHNGAGALTFADGHAENHKWLDARTHPPIQKGQVIKKNRPSPENRDVPWLQNHATSRPSG